MGNREIECRLLGHKWFAWGEWRALVPSTAIFPDLDAPPECRPVPKVRERRCCWCGAVDRQTEGV
jgi:hypothetical protein